MAKVGSGASRLNSSATNDNDSKLTLGAMIAANLEQSPTFYTGDLMSSISQNLDCYNGNPFRNFESQGEQSGTSTQNAPPDKNRSTYQSNDVFDVVELAMPSLMKPFVTSQEIALFEPTRPDAEDIASQQQDLINYNFFKENPGNILLQNAFRNALTCKVGVFHVYWFEGVEYAEREYRELNDKQFLDLLKQENMKLMHDKITETEEMSPNGQPVMMKMHECLFRQEQQISKLKYESVLPENFFVSAAQFSLDLNDPTRKCTFCAERIYMVREDLLDLGIDEELIKQIPTFTQTNQSSVQLSRYFRSEQQIIFNTTADTFNPERSIVEVFKVYIRYDSDNDGRSELHEVYYIDSGHLILKDKIIDDYIPYFAITPIPQPGNFYGYCLADMARPVQLQSTSLVRAMMDNFYFNTIPLVGIDETRVHNASRQSIINRKPGSYFMAEGDPNTAIAMFPPTYAPDSTMKMLSYFDDQRESRTGISKMMAGLDSDILNNNKGDVTANRIMSASEDRIALMAKNFAETGLKSMFYYATTLMMQYETEKKTFRLRNTFVEVDPRTWDAPMDITIKVGIGTGDESKKINALNIVLQNYQLLAQQGAFGVMFTQDNLYQLLKDQAEALGIKYADQYYQDPNSPQAKAYIAQQQKTQSQSPPPTVQDQALMAQVKIDQERNQLDAQRNQLLAQKQQSDAEFKARQMALDEKDQHLKILQGAKDMHNSIETNALNATKLQLQFQPQQEVPGALTR